MSAPAYEAFRRKVEVLESWVAGGGVPEGAFCPSGPAELARWSDPALGLSAWISPNVAAPAPSGHYPDLRMRFDAAISRLLSTRKQTAAAPVSSKLEVRALAEQVAVLAAEHRQMSDALARERQLKEIAQAQLAEARAELARIVPLR